MTIDIRSIRAWREVVGMDGWSRADMERVDWMLKTIEDQKAELEAIKKKPTKFEKECHEFEKDPARLPEDWRRKPWDP